MAKGQLLVIDDQAEICEYLKSVAESLGYTVTIVEDARRAMEAYRRVSPAVIVLDIVMPERDGIEVLRDLAAAGCGARLLLISGSSEFYLASAHRIASDFGLKDVATMRKPFRTGELRRYLAWAPETRGAAED